MCQLHYRKFILNGTPSVKVVRNHRDSGSESPCRWFMPAGKYKLEISKAFVYDLGFERASKFARGILALGALHDLC